MSRCYIQKDQNMSFHRKTEGRASYSEVQLEYIFIGSVRFAITPGALGGYFIRWPAFFKFMKMWKLLSLWLFHIGLEINMESLILQEWGTIQRTNGAKESWTNVKSSKKEVKMNILKPLLQ